LTLKLNKNTIDTESRSEREGNTSRMKIVFQPFDLHDATEDEYQRLSEFKNALQREYAPDDPPIALEEHIQGWRNLPGPTAHEAYALWASANSKIVAYCEVSVPARGENEHPANFMVEVLSEYRRQGIARQALQLIVLFAKKHYRPLLNYFLSGWGHARGW
jgi:GNAT superfamily N-acetyltransferase